jgi:hypothetical protein
MQGFSLHGAHHTHTCVDASCGYALATLFQVPLLRTIWRKHIHRAVFPRVAYAQPRISTLSTPCSTSHMPHTPCHIHYVLLYL